MTVDSLVTWYVCGRFPKGDQLAVAPLRSPSLASLPLPYLPLAPAKAPYVVSMSVLCCISWISTMCRSIGEPSLRIASTASTTCCKHGDTYDSITAAADTLLSTNSRRTLPLVPAYQGQFHETDSLAGSQVTRLIGDVLLFARRRTYLTRTIERSTNVMPIPDGV